MTRNTVTIWALSVLGVGLAAIVVTPVPAVAQDSEQDSIEATVEVGVWDASTSGSPDAVSKYKPSEGGPAVVIELAKDSASGRVDLEADLVSGEDYSLVLDFDVHRSLRSSTEVKSFLHRLVHESVEHFEAATNHGRVTLSTDHSPSAIYGIDYRLLEHRTEYQPANASNWTFALGARRQEREGMRQSTTISHCDACHVVSQSRPVDETTDDALIEVDYAWKGNRIGASFVSRDFEVDPASITLLFDDALHPELRLPLFDNRLQFDSAEGPQDVDRVPQIAKQTYSIDGGFDDVGGFYITAEGVWSETENEYTGLQADYAGYLLSAVRAFKSDWRMSWTSRSYAIDNDDFFVRTNKRLGVAGPQAGRTYEDIYGIETDFLRRSALNRDVVESKLEFSRRLGKKKGTARFYWDYETVDREHYEVTPGQTESTTHVVGASWWARPKKGWKTQVAASHGETDNPFMLPDGQFSTLVSGPAPNPFAPPAAQYYESHDARVADSTASPATWSELKLRGSYANGNTMVSGSYRLWDGDNDQGDMTDWERTMQAVSLSLWSTPRPEWEWQLAYTGSSTELGAPASIPLFDG